jgi:UDP-N-acetylglucosamine transferase subunit ALG13
MPSHAKPLICLAASGGGHVRQILDLEPVWRDYPHYIVTEDTALGRSIGEREEVHFVPHFALGQARLGHPTTMLREAWRSISASWRIIARRRPDLFITTGAGSQLFVMLFARMRGAKVVLIDSFARFRGPSAFARLAGRFAHVRIAQSEESARHWPGATVFDPFRIAEGTPPEKEPLLFATVGATLPFDRLVSLVEHAHAAGLIPEEIVLQHGEGGRAIAGVTSVEGLPFDEVKALLARASIVVCHGGTGSLITALREWCHVIAIPREFGRQEHYDDHQSEIVDAFVERGLVLTAHDDASFAAALKEARARPRVSATTDPAALTGYLKELAETTPAR